MANEVYVSHFPRGGQADDLKAIQGVGPKVAERSYGDLLGFPDVGKPELSSFLEVEIELEGDRRAAVYVTLDYDSGLSANPKDLTESGSAGLHEALRGVKGRVETKITWRWVYQDGQWYCEEPD